MNKTEVNTDLIIHALESEQSITYVLQHRLNEKDQIINELNERGVAVSAALMVAQATSKMLCASIEKQDDDLFAIRDSNEFLNEEATRLKEIAQDLGFDDVDEALGKLRSILDVVDNVQSAKDRTFKVVFGSLVDRNRKLHVIKVIRAEGRTRKPLFGGEFGDAVSSVCDFGLKEAKNLTEGVGTDVVTFGQTYDEAGRIVDLLRDAGARAVIQED